MDGRDTQLFGSDVAGKFALWEKRQKKFDHLFISHGNFLLYLLFYFVGMHLLLSFFQVRGMLISSLG